MAFLRPILIQNWIALLVEHRFGFSLTLIHFQTQLPHQGFVKLARVQLRIGRIYAEGILKVEGKFHRFRLEGIERLWLVPGFGVEKLMVD